MLSLSGETVDAEHFVELVRRVEKIQLSSVPRDPMPREAILAWLRECAHMLPTTEHYLATLPWHARIGRETPLQHAASVLAGRGNFETGAWCCFGVINARALDDAVIKTRKLARMLQERD